MPPFLIPMRFTSQTNRACARLEMERFNQLDWPPQKERIAAFVKRWNALLVMDATGVGDPVYDDLRRVLPRLA